MASSSTTFQIEALSTVHANYADDEKKMLKQKLAECEKELADTKILLLEEQDERKCEGYDILAFCAQGAKQLNNIRLELRKGIHTGMHLSKEDVSQLATSMLKADHRFDDIKYTIRGEDSSDSSNDEDDDEDEQ